MAPKVTSSSNRSKRTSSKPVTKGQNPQRANRQSASNATVTNDGNRKLTGSARVTGSSGQKQLPASGQSTAGSLKARGQRTATAVQQKVQRDIATTRALADMMQRNKARADRQIPADKSPSVRRVGPGGANPKPQGQLPPGQRGGDMRQKGGPLAQRQSSAMTERSREVSRGNNGGPVRQVQVRDMGNTPQKQVSGTNQPALRPARGQVGQPGPERRALPQALQNKIDGKNSGPIGAATKRGMVGEAAIASLGQAALSPLARAAGQKLGEALRPVGRAIDNAMPGMNSKDERSRKTNTPYQTRFPQARANAQVRVNRIKAGTPDAAPQPNRTSQASTPQRPQIASSTPTRSRSTQPVSSTTSRSSSTSTTTQAPTERRVSAATANRESGNYGTSRSNNKLLDGYLRDRMRQREAQSSANAIGPVKDGNTYAGNLKPTTGRGPVSDGNEYGNMLKIDKMKEDKKKKRS